MTLNTADLCDRHPDRISIAEPVFRDFGGATHFSGPITTIRCPGDNTPVKATLQTPGHGGVMVVDGAGLLNFALLGDQLGMKAVANNWAGLVIHGCVRDTEALATLDLGVKALAPYPLKTTKKNPGEKNIPLYFAGIRFIPGHHLYADADGIIVSPEPLD